jgi:hypothetical protein
VDTGGGASGQEVQGGGGSVGGAGAWDEAPRGSALAFIGAGRSRARLPMAAAAWSSRAAPLGPDGLRRVCGWAGRDAGRAFGLGPLGKDRVFFEFIFNAKTNSKKV